MRGIETLEPPTMQPRIA